MGTRTDASAPAVGVQATTRAIEGEIAIGTYDALVNETARTIYRGECVRRAQAGLHGLPLTARQITNAVLTWVRAGRVYDPDPIASETLVSAHLALHGRELPADTDDRAILVGSLLQALGVTVHVTMRLLRHGGATCGLIADEMQVDLDTLEVVA